MSDELKKLVFVLAAAAAVTLLVIFLGPQLLGSAAGAETEILTNLKTAEAKGLILDVGDAGLLKSTRVSFDRVSVVVSGKHATATATLDFDGALGRTNVSSLGLERVRFAESEAREWEPALGFAPDLTAIVRTLEDRRRALESGDLGRLCYEPDAGVHDLEALLKMEHRNLRSTSWLIRNEREGVTVSEDYRLSGELPEKPVDEMGSRRLKLQPGDAGQFCFPEGLM